MKLPERNWYTVENLAKEWSCTTEYIEHLLETRKMKASTRKGTIGDNDASIEELIGDKSRYISRFVLLPKGQKSFPPGTELIIDTAEVRRVEEECNMTDHHEKSSVISETPFLNPKHKHYSFELAAAVNAWLALYDQGAYKSKQGHKDQIEKWIRSKYGKNLSNAAIVRITTLVNPNKEGGAPASDYATE